MGNRFLDAIEKMNEVLKFNPYHAKDGRFTSGEGANSYSWRDGRRYTRAEEEEAFQIQEIKELIGKNGVDTVEQALVVGTKVQEYLGADYQALTDKFSKQVAQMEDKLDVLRKDVEEKIKLARATSSSTNAQEANKAVDAYNNLLGVKRQFEAEVGKDMQAMVSEKLKNLVPMGGEISSVVRRKSNTEAVEALNNASKLYPSLWVDFNSTEVLVMGITNRGYTRGLYEIALSGNSLASRTQVCVHELAHRTASISSTIGRLEKEYYNMRTSGEIAKSLNRVTKSRRYDSSEMTKVDKFVSPYSGKFYADSSDKYGIRATEILSTGIEGIYHPSKYSLDKELQAFSLGVMVGVK